MDNDKMVKVIVHNIDGTTFENTFDSISCISMHYEVKTNKVETLECKLCKSSIFYMLSRLQLDKVNKRDDSLYVCYDTIEFSTKNIYIDCIRIKNGYKFFKNIDVSAINDLSNQLTDGEFTECNVTLHYMLTEWLNINVDNIKEVEICALYRPDINDNELNINIGNNSITNFSMKYPYDIDIDILKDTYIDIYKKLSTIYSGIKIEDIKAIAKYNKEDASEKIVITYTMIFSDSLKISFYNHYISEIAIRCWVDNLKDIGMSDEDKEHIFNKHYVDNHLRLNYIANIEGLKKYHIRTSNGNEDSLYNLIDLLNIMNMTTGYDYDNFSIKLIGNYILIYNPSICDR